MNRTLSLVVCAAVPALIAPAPAAFAQAADPSAADRAALLGGVRVITAPGAPGSLAAYGRSAFPLVVGKSGRDAVEPVAAAGYLGSGRVVGFGHTGYLDPENLVKADTARLFLNSVRWAGRKAAPRVGVFRYAALQNWLKGQGIDATMLTESDRLDGCDVVVGAFSSVGPKTQDALRAFASRGGGLVGAETGWGWLQLNDGKALTENGGNRVFTAAGILWNDGTPDRTAPGGYSVDLPAEPRLLNAAAALDALASGGLSKQQQAQAVFTVSRAAQGLPPGDTLLQPRLRALERTASADFTAISKQKPVSMETPQERLVLTLQVRDAMRAPVGQVKAHPAAISFPGPVPSGAKRIAREVTIDTRTPDWHSTGLYAAPGETITVRIPASAARKGLRVRIGTHKDTLWHLDRWFRAPEITRAFALDAEETKAANAFGGAVIIEVPKNSALGSVTVAVGGAVEAPHFVRGKTSPAEWKRVRTAPGPWAELQGEKCILSVPSEVVRALDDPQALMAYWDEVITECNKLYAVKSRPRPERYCVDRQISAGYMHAGYPIMTGDDVAARFVDTAHLRSKDGNVWGFYHEVGHNYQEPEWTFGGTGEVTNNLFSLYGFETLNGKTGIPHPAMEPTKVRERLEKYLADGAPFEQWKGDPFLALTMYWQLRQGFGWDAYKKVFAEYAALGPAERPKTDAEKHDQWLVRFSRTAGRNLGPFFEAWGVPTSEKARQSVASLPAWMPADWPKRAAAK